MVTAVFDWFVEHQGTKMPALSQEAATLRNEPQCGPLSLVEVQRGPALIGRESFRVLLVPALLCHKEPALSTQSPLLGALERKILQLLAGSLWHKG